MSVLDKTQLFDKKTETKKFNNVFNSFFNYQLAQKQKLYNNAYNVYVLGDYTWGSILISRAMPLEVWRRGYGRFIEGMAFSGTVEQYISLFKGIFTEDVEVEFTVPEAGKLHIDIGVPAGGLEFFEWLTIDGDNIEDDTATKLFFARVLTQLESRELLRVLLSSSPAGIDVTFTLTEV